MTGRPEWGHSSPAVEAVRSEKSSAVPMLSHWPVTFSRRRHHQVASDEHSKLIRLVRTNGRASCDVIIDYMLGSGSSGTDSSAAVDAVSTGDTDNRRLWTAPSNVYRRDSGNPPPRIRLAVPRGLAVLMASSSGDTTWPPNEPIFVDCMHSSRRTFECYVATLREVEG